MPNVYLTWNLAFNSEVGIAAEMVGKVIDILERYFPTLMNMNNVLGGIRSSLSLLLQEIEFNWKTFSYDVLNDAAVDLPSQLGKEGNTGRGYKGFTTYKKCFNVVSVSSLKGSFISLDRTYDANWRITHNLETMDVGMLSYIVKRISLSGNQNGSPYLYTIKNDGTVSINGYIGVCDGDTLSIPSTIVVKDGGVYSVTEIGNSAFAYDMNGETSIKHIIIPNTVKTIATCAFMDNDYLETVSFEGNCELIEIGDHAFDGCSALKRFNSETENSLYITENIARIGKGAFAGCNNLNIIVSASNPNYSAEENILYNKEKTEIIATGRISSIINIPESITSILPYAFEGNNNLLELTIVHTPNIGQYAFANCINLKSAYFYSYSVPEMEGCTFLNNDFTLYVPHSKQGEYNAEFMGYTNRITSIPIAVTFISDSEEIGKIDTYYGAIIQDIIDPFKEGYDFSGWYENEDYTGAVYENGGIWDSTTDLTVYAKWTPRQFYVTFSGYGSEGLEDKLVTYDAEIGALPIIEKEGHTFAGWKDEHNVYYTENTIWRRTSNLILNSDFQVNYYDIIYVGNGGTPSIASQSVAFGSVVNTFATATQEGNTFTGWNTCADGSGEIIAAPYEYLTADNITVYAQYLPNTYVVMFDKQGGSGGTNGVNAIFGSPMLTGNDITAPKKTGYTFGGYYLGIEGSGKRYYFADMTSANDWDIASPMTLYANWIGNEYSVKLDRNTLPGFGEDITSTSSSDIKYIYFVSIVSGSITLWTSHTNGDPYLYLYDVNFNTLSYNDDGYGNSDSKITYSVTEGTVYIVGFRAYGTTSTTGKVYLNDDLPTKITAVYGDDMPFGNTIPNANGYIFQGYYSQMNGGGTKYYNADMTSANPWNIASVTTLYAYYIKDKYHVIFDKQSGSGGSDSVSATYLETMPAATVPTRTGYNFKGYFTGTKGSGIQYYDGNMRGVRRRDIAGDKTLYAGWEGMKYTVTLNSGGYGGTSSVTATFGAYLPETGVVAPKRTGYTFIGYFAQENGRGKKYYDGPNMQSIEEWDKTMNATLYAYWEKNEYKITLDYDYEITKETISVRYQEPVIADARSQHVFDRIGYDFKGFYSGRNGTGRKYFGYNIEKLFSEYCYKLESTGEIWNEDKNGVLYAWWTVIDIDYVYEIVISNNDEPRKSASVHMKHGDNITINAPSISGYKFEKMWINGSYYETSTYTLNNVQLKRNLSYGIVDVDNAIPVYLWYPSSSQTNRGGLFMVYAKDSNCIAKGTLVTLADGNQKAVEELTGTEQLLVWNLFTGKFDYAPILFIDKDALATYQVINLVFSDGTSLKVIGEHGLWDYNLNRYVYLDKDAAKYIGHWFNKQTTDEIGKMISVRVQLTGVTIAMEQTITYSPVTYGHLCYYVNGLLSMPGGYKRFV